MPVFDLGFQSPWVTLQAYMESNTMAKEREEAAAPRSVSNGGRYSASRAAEKIAALEYAAVDVGYNLP